MPVRVRLSETDEEGKLSKVSLLNYFQDCCTLQSEDCGYGLEWLAKEDKGWFVTAWQIHLYRMPRMGEYVDVHTLPTKIKGFFGFRDFVAKDKNGETIAEANSHWIYMDHASMKPSRVPEGMIEGYSLDEPLPIEWEKGKLKEEEGLVECGVQRVEHFHLDYNGHMNNSHYLNMAERILPEGFNYNSLRIEYKTQALEGEQIHLFLSNNETSKTVALKADNGELYCILRFDKRED